MSKITAQILEDNGGTIHWVTDDGRSCSSDRPNAGALLADLASLTEWIDDPRNDRPDEADTVSFDEAGMIVIAEIDANKKITVYAARMGAAARLYTGIAAD